MDFLSDIYYLLPSYAWQLISFLASLSAILFIHFSAKYRNIILRPVWYLAALFFPVFACLFYLSKRRAYKNIKVRICENCGTSHPINFEYCNRCLAKLPEYNPAKKAQQKTLAIVFACLFVVFYLFNFVSDFTVVTDLLGDYTGADTQQSRISFMDSDGYMVYYDRNGEEYYDAFEVVLYDRDGNSYYYEYYDGAECFYKDDGKVSLWEEDDYIPAYNCYVDEEGYFVDVSGENELAIVEFEEPETYYYFNTVYTDLKGNAYYPAMYASWNAEGELITSLEQLSIPPLEEMN